MQSTVLLTVFLAFFALVAGHTYFSTLVINNVRQTPGDCIRPHPGGGWDSPIATLNSPEMTCGHLPEAAQAANKKCTIAAGSQVGIQWNHANTNTNDDVVDGSHKGPCIVYLASSETGSGNVWFKIWEQGYDPTTKKWCVDNILANDPKGLFTFTLPNNLAPGNYLLRAEIIALHGAYDVGGAQPYVHCAEITVTGSGTVRPNNNLVAFPGAYSNEDPGIHLSIYYPEVTNYIVPGPAVYDMSSSDGGATDGGATDGGATDGGATDGNGAADGNDGTDGETDGSGGSLGGFMISLL